MPSPWGKCDWIIDNDFMTGLSHSIYIQEEWRPPGHGPRTWGVPPVSWSPLGYLGYPLASTQYPSVALEYIPPPMEGKKAIAICDVKRQYQCARWIGQRLEVLGSMYPWGPGGPPGTWGVRPWTWAVPLVLGGYPQDLAGTPVWVLPFALFSQLLEVMLSKESSPMW